MVDNLFIFKRYSPPLMSAVANQLIFTVIYFIVHPTYFVCECVRFEIIEKMFQTHYLPALTSISLGSSGLIAFH